MYLQRSPSTDPAADSISSGPCSLILDKPISIVKLHLSLSSTPSIYLVPSTYNILIQNRTQLASVHVETGNLEFIPQSLEISEIPWTPWPSHQKSPSSPCTLPSISTPQNRSRAFPFLACMNYLLGSLQESSGPPGPATWQSYNLPHKFPINSTFCIGLLWCFKCKWKLLMYPFKLSLYFLFTFRII